MTTRAAIDDFLSGRRIAFVGASHDPKSFSASVYREMRDHGYELFPVNPHAEEVLGDHCVATVADLPADIDGAIVMVPATESAAVAQACADHGIPRVWLHKGVGPSSVSDEAIDVCQAHGITLVGGECPLMFLEPAQWIHRAHRFERRVTGHLPV